MNNNIRITKRSVDALKPGASAYRMWDRDLVGFGVRVQPSGARSYFISYRPGDGGRKARRVEYTLGKHGILSAEQARDLAQRKLAGVRLGENPQDDRNAGRAAGTVDDLCDEYLKEAVATKKPSTVQSDRYRINSHVRPLLGKMKLIAVRKEHIERFRDDVALGRTAYRPQGARKRTDPMAKGGRGTATRTIGLLGAIFQFAVDRGMRPDNPVRGVKKFTERKCDRYLTADEISRLGSALSASNASPFAKTIIRILLLTGARKGEIEALRWREVDFERGLLRLEDSKTGEKTIPVTQAVLDLLKAVPKPCSSVYVFPSLRTKGAYYRGTKRVWEELRIEADLPDLRLHDLRHTFASLAVSSGASLPMIGRLLGHRDSKTTERYAHLQADPVRAISDAISAELSRSLKSTARS